MQGLFCFILSIASLNLFASQDLLSSKSYFESPQKYDVNALNSSINGDFSPSFKVDLHVNPQFKFLRRGIIFNYSAQKLVNVGYGLGWSNSLPKLLFKFEKGEKKIYFVESNSNIELLERNGIFIEKYPKTFLKMRKSNGYYEVNFPNGVTKLFDLNGNILSERDHFIKNIVEYKWDNSYLKKILINGNSYRFSYFICTKGEKLKLGQREFNGKCLDYITVNEKKIAKFKYNLNQLVSVVNANDVKIFTGEYNVIDNPRKEVELDQILFEDMLVVNSGNNQHHFIFPHEINSKIGSYIGERAKFFLGGKSSGHLMIDLNADGISDIITFNLTRKAGKKITDLGDIITGNEYSTCKQEYKNKKTNVKVFTGYLSDSGNVEYRVENGFEDNLNFDDFATTVVSGNIRIANTGLAYTNRSKCQKAEEKVGFYRHIFIGDFDGNDLPDIFLCNGGQSFVYYNEEKKFSKVQLKFFDCKINNESKAYTYNYNNDDKDDLYLDGSIYTIKGDEVVALHDGWKIKNFEYTPVEEGKMYFDKNNDGNYKVWEIGKKVGETFDTSIKHPVLVSYQNKLGLKIDLKWTYKHLRPHLTQISIDKFDYVKKINYISPVYSNGFYLGNSVVTSKTNDMKNRHGGLNIKSFYADDFRRLLLPKEHFFCRISQCGKLIGELKQKGAVTDVSYDLRTRYSYLVYNLDHLDLYKGLGFLDQNLVYKIENENGQIFKSEKYHTKSGDFTTSGPGFISVENLGHSGGIEERDHRLKDKYQKIEKYFNVQDDRFLPYEMKTYLTGEEGIYLDSVETFTRGDLFNEHNLTKNGKTKTIRAWYDDFGRETKKIENNLETITKYEGNKVFITSDEDNLALEYKNGKLVSKISPFVDESFSYNYSGDLVTSKINETVNYNYDYDSGLEISYFSSGSNYSLKYNEVGYLISSDVFSNNKKYTLVKNDVDLWGNILREFGPNNSKIIERFYDHLGRLIKEVDYEKKKTTTYSFFNGCEYKRINRIFIEKKCKRLDGGVKSFENFNSSFNVLLAPSKRVNFLNKLEFNYDIFNEVNSVNTGFNLIYKKTDDLENGKRIVRDKKRRIVEIVSPSHSYSVKYDTDGNIGEKKVHDLRVSTKRISNKIESKTFLVGDKKLVEKYSYKGNLLNSMMINNNLIQYKYELGKLSGLDNFFSVERDLQGRVILVNYNDFSVTRKIENGRISKIRAPGFEEEISYDPRTSKIASVNSEIFSYENVFPKITPLKKRYARDKYMAVMKDGFLSSFDYFTSINNKLVKYSSQNSIYSLGNEKYLSNVLHFIDDQFIRYQYVDNILVGAFVIGNKSFNFYPIVTDYKGSVRRVYDNNGNILIEKEYDIWGNLTSEAFGDDNLGRIIRKDYARMTRPHGEDFLISDSRIYLPESGEWATMDPALINRPDVFLSRLDETDGITYGLGDPINYIDPSGHFAVSAGLLAVGAINTGAMGAFWVATKIAMWAGGLNTSEMNAQLNQGMLVGAGAGFTPAVVAAGIEAGMAFGAAGMNHVYRNAPFYAAANKVGGKMVSGAFDSAPPSEKWQWIGWGAWQLYDNRQEISDSFNDFSSSFSRQESYYDSGFRFYEHTPSTSTSDPYSIGNWEF